MSESRAELVSDAALDALIDDAARALIASPGHTDLRRRVLHRIQTQESRNHRAFWLTAPTAAAIVCIAAFVWNGVSRESRTVTRAVLNEGDAGAGQAPRALTGAPVAAASAATESPAAATIRGSGPEELFVDGPPPGYDSLILAETTLPAMTVNDMSAIETIDVNAIPMESLWLDALGTD